MVTNDPRRIALTLAVAGLTCAATSAAEELVARDTPPSDASQSHLALQGIVGLGTPVGYGGFLLDFSPIPAVALSVGAGLGSGTENTDCLQPGHVGVCGGPLADRVQVAAMGRLRWFHRPKVAFTLGLGVSTGGYSWDEFTTDAPAHKSIDRAYWLNAELGSEYHAASGFNLRTFAGYGRMLNPSDLQCVDTGVNSDHCPNDHQHDGEGLVYFGVGVGWDLY